MLACDMSCVRVSLTASNSKQYFSAASHDMMSRNCLFDASVRDTVRLTPRTDIPPVCVRLLSQSILLARLSGLARIVNVALSTRLPVTTDKLTKLMVEEWELQLTFVKISSKLQPSQLRLPHE
jgi:hypothetical protein